MDSENSNRLTENANARLDEILGLLKSQSRDSDDFQPDKDAISAEAWLELSNTLKHQSKYKQRRQLLGYWAIANGRTIEQVRVRSHLTFKVESLVKEVNAVLDDIKSNKIRVYETGIKFWKWLENEGYSSQTRTQYRSILPDFFLKVLGTRNFSRDKYDSIVPNEKVYTEVTKLIPTFEQARQMAHASDLQYRALVGCFVNLGWRIEEILSRKWSDLEIRKEGYARVHIKAEDTKARYERYGFLTPEVVGYIQKFRDSLIDTRQKSQWIFPGFHTFHAENVGETYRAKGTEQKVTAELIGLPKFHLRTQVVEIELKRLFKEVGCEDAKDGSAIYSSHSFRTLCDSLLSRHGLDRKFVDLTIGHKAALGANISYKDWAEVEKQWKERCLTGMTLEQPTEIVKEVVDPEARKVVKFLVGVFWDRMSEEEKAKFGLLKSEIGNETLEEAKAKRKKLPWREYGVRQLEDKSDKSESEEAKDSHTRERGN